MDSGLVAHAHAGARGRRIVDFHVVHVFIHRTAALPRGSGYDATDRDRQTQWAARSGVGSVGDAGAHFYRLPDCAANVREECRLYDSFKRRRAKKATGLEPTLEDDSCDRRIDLERFFDSADRDDLSIGLFGERLMACVAAAVSVHIAKLYWSIHESELVGSSGEQPRNERHCRRRRDCARAGFCLCDRENAISWKSRDGYCRNAALGSTWYSRRDQFDYCVRQPIHFFIRASDGGYLRNRASRILCTVFSSRVSIYVCFSSPNRCRD